MNCTKCGTPLQPEDRFCYYCGMPVEKKSTEPVMPVEQSISEQPATPVGNPVPEPSIMSTANSMPEQSVSPIPPTMTEEHPISSFHHAEPPHTAPPFGNPVPTQGDIQQAGVQAVAVMSPQNRKSSGRTILGILLIAVGCLIIVGIVMSLFVGGSYKSALKEMWYEVERQNTDSAVACMFPEEAEGQVFTTTEFMDRYIQELHTRAEARYGEKYHIHVKFDEIDKLDASERKRFNSWFGNLSLEEEVKKVYAVDYTLSIKGSKGRESEECECYIYRYDGNWYVLDTDLLGLQDPL